MRSSGFEPPRYCYRQPLKLVRLPVPPRPRENNPKRPGIALSNGHCTGCARYFFGAGFCAGGCDCAGAGAGAFEGAG